MDKNAIKKYAVWARQQLIEKVTTKAIENAICDGQELDDNLSVINGKPIDEKTKKQRKALIKRIKEEGYMQVMEEVAYIWFNRFVAIRFMEVNGYLPSHVRVFSDESGAFRPQILAEAIHLEMEGLDKEKVFQLQDEANNDELFKYLLIVQCNALNEVLPYMFQKLEDYTELLLPDYLLREGSVIEKLVNDIPDEYFNVSSDEGQIEIIGWLYQYYNDEKKTAIIDMAGKTAIEKDDIPAATQLFTTDWVVKYIVDNSLGRYWIERNPESKLAQKLSFYMKTEEEKSNLESIRPQELTVFDPCVGSGHFLVYVFEVLVKIYLECGYSERDAAAQIVENNIYGVDIDERASQLAYFAVMMKARQYDRRFLTKKIQPHVHVIAESNNVSESSYTTFAANDEKLLQDVLQIGKELKDAKEYGSLVKIDEHDYKKLFERINNIGNEIGLFNDNVIAEVKPLIETAKILSQKYAVVVTNPPYLNKYNGKLKAFINDNYKDYSGDLFSAFMYRNFGFCKNDGYSGFMTPFVWMFIKTYEPLRLFLIRSKRIVSLIQMEYSAFEEATVPICSFVFQNGHENRYGQYIRLSDFKGGMEVQRNKVLEAISDWNSSAYTYDVSQEKYEKIPGAPIAYWMPDSILNSFENGKKMEDIAEIVTGISTGKNNIYLRLWQEVDFTDMAIYKSSMNEIDLAQTKWIPYNKGGEARKWYGNNEYVVKWSESEKFHRARPTFAHLYLKQGITWSFVTSGMFSARYYPDGFLWDVAGSPCVINDEDLMYYALGYLSTSIAGQILKIINPTINCQVIDIQRTPIIVDKEKMPEVVALAKEAVEISKTDWDSFEQSWDFKRHPLIPRSGEQYIEECYKKWETSCNERFDSLKRIEIRLNQIFKIIFAMENDPFAEEYVDDNKVTVHRADLKKDIKSFISYAVGCMLGRYSLDETGLVFAGGKWDETKYKSYKPDADAIIPICNDEYFADDIVDQFVEFVENIYGRVSLEDNLQYVANALGVNGSAREVIRNYFINDFYADHVKIYQKRPIYWLFDSGKNNGFKCLIYMHRYQPDTIARIRTDYVHEQQARYRTAIEETTNRIESAAGSDKIKLTKKLNTLKAQDEEIHTYEEKIHHLADKMISIDLDDGVKHNYEIFKDVLAKIK